MVSVMLWKGHTQQSYVYLRIEYSDGNTVNVNKDTGVTDKEAQTGATILARLLNTVQQQLNSLPLAAKSYFWTDSFTTLCWIKNECQ